MILPIIGVIGFQSYWIINTYKINEEGFQKDIKAALQSAIKNDIINQTKDKLPMLDSTLNGAGQIDISSNMYQSGDSTILEELIGMLSGSDTIPPENVTIHISGTDDEMIPFEGLPFDKLPDSAKIMGDTTFIVETSSDFSMDGSLKDMMLRVIADLTGHATQLESIDSLYKESLLETGLELDYKMALYKGGKFIGSTKGDSVDFQNPDTKACIDKLYTESPELRVVIPEKASFLLLNMWMSLSTSLLLVIVVIGTFIYMLTVIMRQKKLSDMKNDFINNMTHECKTPIATVSAAIESMQNFGVLDDKVKTKNYLNISQKELVRLNSMVDKVLDISAYEKQKVVLNKEVIYLSDIAKDVVERFRLQDEDKTSIVEEIMGDIQIFADRMHIQNLINNLLDNGVKYCDKIPVINVKCKIKDGMAELRIKDNGIGISKDHQRLIFDKFYRAPGNSMHSVKGFGLGLSYVKHVVEQHEGQIYVFSMPGVGSEFVIQLPLSDGSN
ncbi:MAG: HAMP domain-containing histidine kinase [Bacteroidetes bacterium]|jgi:two-component system, OmpR family, phosphate regulon sensor histidine kinase PhoR|nr:HAMP domain-containing histidine kinase [Bacteroidota bacterium]